MRETYRSDDNKTYWTKRWENIGADEKMENKDSYPLKYTLEAISHKDNNQKILEAGCGAGRIVSYLHDNNFKVVGIEFIRSAIEKIKLKFPKLNVHTMDILNTKFENNEFDTILAFGLYHNFQIDMFEKALDETKRILKDDGLLCFSFRSDNIQNYILDKIKDNEKSKKHFHKLNLKKNEISKILARKNFRIIKSYYVLNMPLLFHFKIFRSSEQKNFNEHLGRKKGYSLNFIGKIFNKILILFFKKHYCNIHVIYCKKLLETPKLPK